MKQVKIKEAFSYGWETMLKNFWTFVLAMIITFFVAFFANWLEKLSAGIFDIVLWVIYYILMGFISAFIVKIALNIFEKRNAFEKIGEIFPKLIRYVIASLLYSIIVMIGFILFIIPGFIFMIKYQYVLYLIIDKNLAIGEAFRKSNELASGVQWPLFYFFILSMIVSGIGFLCFGIGALFTVPTVWMAVVFVYKSLLKQVNN